MISGNKKKSTRLLIKISISPIILMTIFTLSVDTFCDAERVFPGNPYSHREMLDPNGKFLLEWIADPKNSDVVFNITAETRGYVALGFSKTGKMAKSDIVFAGVSRGIPYVSDRFTRHDKRIPVEDIQQNWKMLQAWENRTHTSVRISRNKDTCDPQDYIISVQDNTMHLLWAFGEDDTVDYHFKNRGSVPIQLLQPDLQPQVPPPPPSPQQQRSGVKSNSSKPQPGLDVWRLTVTVNSVASGGSWCVFQKGPELRKMFNIIGFSTPVTDEKVAKHLDRLIIYKCLPQYGRDSQRRNAFEDAEEMMQAELEKLDEYSGECKNATELFSFCKDIIYTWGKGGKDVFLPKNVGIPFGGADEYYLLQSYLIAPKKNETDSPAPDDQESLKSKKDEEFDIDTDILLTESPKKYEAKILRLGYDPMTPVLVPLSSTEFEVFGHCPNECTSKMVPKRKPLRAFGVSFDTGAFGRSVTLHQLRNAFELPILLHNGNYDPTFQQMQILPLETPIRQGDQVTVRCKYKSAAGSSLVPTPSPSSVTNNSNSIPVQMHRCIAYLWYYQDKGNSSTPTDNPHFYECTSKIHPGDFARWMDESTPIEVRRNIGSPEMLDKLRKLKWTPHLQLSLYELYELGRYRSSCGGVIQRHENQTNGTNRIGNNRSNGNNNGTSRPAGSSSSSAPGEITVYPLPVEDIPNTIGCPTLDGPLLLGPPGPVIFGFP